MSTDRKWTDDDLDQLAASVHEHVYMETIDSRYKNSFGEQIRKFICRHCGKIREIPIKTKDSK